MARIGAFALSSNIFVIAIGLGIGAMFVRSLTVMLVDRGTLTEYPYLETGAFYAIDGARCYVTRSGYVITPVVVWSGGEVELVPDPNEVAHAYRIGVHELLRDDSPRFVTIPESDRPVVQEPLGRDLIHAPTGAVLLQFRWVALDGRADARVHHYDQPVFAWK